MEDGNTFSVGVGKLGKKFSSFSFFLPIFAYSLILKSNNQ